MTNIKYGAFVVSPEDAVITALLYILFLSPRALPATCLTILSLEFHTNTPSVITPVEGVEHSLATPVKFTHTLLNPIPA